MSEEFFGGHFDYMCTLDGMRQVFGFLFCFLYRQKREMLSLVAFWRQGILRVFHTITTGRCRNDIQHVIFLVSITITEGPSYWVNLWMEVFQTILQHLNQVESLAWNNLIRTMKLTSFFLASLSYLQTRGPRTVALCLTAAVGMTLAIFCRLVSKTHCCRLNEYTLGVHMGL